MKLQPNAKNYPTDWFIGEYRKACAYCGALVSDHYMLKDQVWLELGLSVSQQAHLKCVHENIEGGLKIEHFEDVPLNDLLFIGAALREREIEG